MNNNSIEVDDNRSSDDVIDIASTEDINKLHNQPSNCESELTQRTEHADNDKSAKVNVYEQVNARQLALSIKTFADFQIFPHRSPEGKKTLRARERRGFNVF